MINLHRRRFLSGISATGFGLATGLLSNVPAIASTGPGYKALVCLYLDGGMDSADTILPVDTESARELRELRTDILDAHAREGSSREPDDLLELQSERGFEGRRFGLPQELSGLHDLYRQGRLAVVGNVGPLIEPTSRADMAAGRAVLPRRLFSHNDQRATWLTNDLEGRRPGWGGDFAKQISNAGGDENFRAITAGGETAFLRSESVFPFVAAAGSAPKITVVDKHHTLGAGRGGDEARRILADHLASRGHVSDNMIVRDLIAGNARTRDNTARFNAALRQSTVFDVPFPGTNIGKQLATIARAIAANGSLSAGSQVFYAKQTGYDTHQDQVGVLPRLQRELDAAIVAFDSAMGQLGMRNGVTLFTASDFGRTIVANGNGTDHGWGGHHFVLGGGVRGGEIYGDIPSFDRTDEAYTASRARLIPSTSVDQFAGALGRWLGLDTGTMKGVLPNLKNFDTLPDLFGLGAAI